MIDQVLVILADTSMRGIAVAVLVAFILTCSRIRSGRARHRAWTVVLAVMLVMPALSRVAPSIDVPAPVALPMMTPTEPAVVTTFPAAVPAPLPATASVGSVSASPTPTERVTPFVSSRDRRPWSVILFVIYFIGVLLLVGRLLIGMWASGRLIRSGRTFVPDFGADVLMSDRVAAPITVGILRPKLLLPRAASAWSDAKLAVVLTHERAHISGHHLFGVWLALVNRALFWFNPVVWWLERQVRMTAEHAADAAAVRAAGGPTFYASVLLEIADDMQRAGGRFVPQSLGVGVDGRGSLSQRVDRVLGGRVAADLSPIRQSGLIASCIAVGLFVAACRQQDAPAPLVPDPEVTTRLENQRTTATAWDAARAMSADEVVALERQLADDPEDVEVRRQLVTYYVWLGDNKQSWNDNVAARRRHALWLIANHPDSELIGLAHLWQGADPDGYREARRLWLSEIDKSDVDVKTLSNAAHFFEATEKPLAETLLLRARAQDPDGPTPRVDRNIYFPSWTERLGNLYAQAIVGSVAPTLFNVVRETSLREAHSQYANDVRRKLAESRDVALLSAAGSYLIRNAGQAKVDFDQRALGRSYLERVLQLDPNANQARSVLRSHDEAMTRQRLRALVHTTSSGLAGGEIARKVREGEPLTRDEQDQLDDVQEEAVALLSEVDRFAWLPMLMETEATWGEQGNDARAAEGRARSQRHAQNLLMLAEQFRADPGYGAARYRAHVVLATHALRAGDKAGALAHMRDALAAPVTTSGDAYDAMVDQRLAHGLLDAGERENVAAFLEGSAKRMPPGPAKDRRLASAADIRAGRMPLAYQVAQARRQ